MKTPAPRLLPLTILALGGLLAVKSLWLLQAWPDEAGLGVVSTAQAAGHGAPEKKASGHAPPPKHAAPAPAPTPAPGPPPEPPAPPGPPPISESERAVLLELRQRREELERRDAAVATRESVLAATEGKLAARVDELRSLQSQLSTLDTERQRKEEANWQSLVKLYETMKPRDAAAIFNDLTMPVLMPLITRMKETKAAPILAAMAPDKARDLTARIAKSKGRLDMPPEGDPASPMPANSSRSSPPKS